jgi:N-acetylmuramoyl-L-alanine amidase
VISLLKLTPYPGDIAAPSPNHGARKAHAIEGIVLHATEDGGDESRSLSWLRSPKSGASCHLLVARSGRVVRLVGDQQRAWHAGASLWRGQRDVNSITLGIEIANRNDGEPYTAAQYDRVADIVAHYCRQGLSLNAVVSHGEIAPGRKTDPAGWDWQRFRLLVNAQLQPPAAQVTPVPRPTATTPRRVVPLGTPVAPPAAAPAELPLPTRHLSAPAASRAAAKHPAKPLLRSRTIWWNALTVLAAIAAIVGETLHLAFWVGFTVPERVTVWALFVVGVINIVLRFWTTQPICTTEPVPPPRGYYAGGTLAENQLRR